MVLRHGRRMIAYLKGLETQFPGLQVVNVQSSMGTPESVMIEQLERFAAEVMPAFTASRRRSLNPSGRCRRVPCPAVLGGQKKKSRCTRSRTSWSLADTPRTERHKRPSLHWHGGI